MFFAPHLLFVYFEDMLPDGPQGFRFEVTAVVRACQSLHGMLVNVGLVLDEIRHIFASVVTAPARERSLFRMPEKKTTF